MAMPALASRAIMDFASLHAKVRRSAFPEAVDDAGWPVA
jgi:hypothetical protein